MKTKVKQVLQDAALTACLLQSKNCRCRVTSFKTSPKYWLLCSLHVGESFFRAPTFQPRKVPKRLESSELSFSSARSIKALSVGSSALQFLDQQRNNCCDVTWSRSIVEIHKAGVYHFDLKSRVQSLSASPKALLEAPGWFKSHLEVSSTVPFSLCRNITRRGAMFSLLPPASTFKPHSYGATQSAKRHHLLIFSHSEAAASKEKRFAVESLSPLCLGRRAWLGMASANFNLGRSSPPPNPWLCPLLPAQACGLPKSEVC